MRHPARYRNAAWVMVGLCAGLVLASAVIPEDAISKDLRVGFFAVGLIGGVVSLVMAGIWTADARLYNRLVNGTDVLAQWDVPSAMWSGYLEIDKQRAPQTPDYPSTAYKYASAWPGMQVIVGQRAVVIGTDFHRVPTRHGDKHMTGMNWLPGNGFHVCELLFYTVYASKNGVRRVYEALRFPVALEHVQAMQEVLQVYADTANEKAARQSLMARYPRGIRNVALLIVVLGGIAFAGGLYANRHSMLVSQQTAAIVGITGAMVGIAALLFVVIAQVFLFRQRKNKP